MKKSIFTHRISVSSNEQYSFNNVMSFHVISDSCLSSKFILSAFFPECFLGI